MTNTRNVPVRSLGFSASKLAEMRKKAEEQANSNEPREFNKYPWFDAKDIPIFEPEVGIYTFDIVQMKVGNYHPYLAKKYKMYDLGNDALWLDFEVETHTVFHGNVQTLVCKKTFGSTYNRITKQFDNDAVCEFLWNNRDEGFRRSSVNKTFVIYLIRMYPNATIGNTDYQFMWYIPSKGTFPKLLRQEMEIMEQCNDTENLGFYMWDKAGRSCKVRYSMDSKELPTADGTKLCQWVTASKLDFVDRADQLTDDDLNFINSLDVRSQIAPYSEEKCEEMADILSGNVRTEVERKPATVDADGKDEIDRQLDDTFGSDTITEPVAQEEDSINW